MRIDYMQTAGHAVSGARVEVWRGPLLESRHDVHVAVCDAAGRLRGRAGDAHRVTFARSAVKPLQALPLVEDGVIEEFGLATRDLALFCASHNGEPRHVAAVAAILARIGASANDLACGPHPPLYAPAAAALQRKEQEPTRLHNNCSGKHAGMLALARKNGWPLHGYERPEHAVQRRIAETIARWSSRSVDDIPTAVDGCGVPTFALPLSALAGAFAALGAAGRSYAGRTDGAGRVVEAMTQHPEMVAGTARLCTELMRITGGRVFAKVGAEGVYCAGVPGAELGIALKVEDGASRAAEPALLAVLRVLGLLSEDELVELESFAEPEIRNTRDERVGRIRAIVELEPGHG
jgi:L-asparaginase II